MLVHPQFNPIALQVGPVGIHWYGISYLVAFGLFLWLASRRVRLPHFADAGWVRRDVEDLLFYGVIGVILGGRLGFVLFYNLSHYLAHPLEIFAVWKGGMSFHGGMLGVGAAMTAFAWAKKRSPLNVLDLVIPCVPTGLASGRMGNFINGELYGRFADPSLPWAMVFPQSGSEEPRHPSQLYQFGMEGMLLFVLLWIYAKKPRASGQVTAAFLFGYGVCRFVAEYFRQPDKGLENLPLGLSMGQWLCVPMVLGGALMWVWAGQRGRAPVSSAPRAGA
ncbi:MAG: diacylglyceryl transferase [Pseudomonadota bacterium]